jgi:hypothetical protein
MMGQQQQTVTAAGGALRRMILLLAVMAVMVALMVAPAFARSGGLGALTDFCAAHNGDMSIMEGDIPTCTYTEITEEVPAQHGFTLTTSQLVTLNLPQWVGDAAPTPVEGVDPVVVSCQNPGGIDVSKDDNPNCTPAS